jgi:uncharacterized RDD family membrane protein YckC
MAQPYQPPPSVVVDGPAPGVRFASPVARVIGYIIDGFITGAAVLVLGLGLGAIIGLAGEAGRNFIAGLGFILYFLAILVIWLLYFPYFWQKSGQTPGMKVMKIKVVRDEDGGPIGWGTGIVRLFGFWVSSIVFYIGFIWVLVDKRRRGWFDLMAGTCVVEA